MCIFHEDLVYGHLNLISKTREFYLLKRVMIKFIRIVIPEKLYRVQKSYFDAKFGISTNFVLKY